MGTISDEQLKAYFLGKLAEPEAEFLEIECASSMELSERAQTVERELTDDYLRGNLSAADIGLYETNYLITEARRNKLQVAAQLWKIVNEPAPPLIQPVESKTSPAPFWQTIFGKRRGAQLAFGGLLFLVVCGAVAFYLLTLSVDKRDVAEVREINQPETEAPAAQNPDSQPIQTAPVENQTPKSASTDRGVQDKETKKETNAPQKNPPEIKTVPAPKTEAPNRLAVMMTIKLMPGSVRGEGDEQSFTIAPDVKNLKLLLSPDGEPNNYKIYRAVVRTPDNRTIFTASNLKALSFTIPAEKLESRTYIISLEGENRQNDFESIADYTFRVRR
jgi:hypothetical protein